MNHNMIAILLLSFGLMLSACQSATISYQPLSQAPVQDDVNLLETHKVWFFGKSYFCGGLLLS